jgi:CheY-like chemotaxis protein
LIQRRFAHEAKMQNDLSTTRPLRILVVDDNRDAAAALAILLRLWGNEVRTVLRGSDALVLAPSFRPDFILLDIEMPHMHGGMVAQYLRQMPELERSVIIAVSGTDPLDDRLDGYRSLFDDYIMKPYNLQRLEHLLARHAPAGMGEHLRA